MENSITKGKKVFKIGDEVNSLVLTKKGNVVKGDIVYQVLDTEYDRSFKSWFCTIQDVPNDGKVWVMEESLLVSL